VKIQQLHKLPLETKLNYVWRQEGNKLLFGEAVELMKSQIEQEKSVVADGPISPENNYTGVTVFLTQNDNTSTSVKNNNNNDDDN
jgi:hypothetical protein